MGRYEHRGKFGALVIVVLYEAADKRRQLRRVWNELYECFQVDEKIGRWPKWSITVNLLHKSARCQSKDTYIAARHINLLCAESIIGSRSAIMKVTCIHSIAIWKKKIRGEVTHRKVKWLKEVSIWVFSKTIIGSILTCSHIISLSWCCTHESNRHTASYAPMTGISIYQMLKWNDVQGGVHLKHHHLSKANPEVVKGATVERKEMVNRKSDVCYKQPDVHLLSVQTSLPTDETLQVRIL